MIDFGLNTNIPMQTPPRASEARQGGRVQPNADRNTESSPFAKQLAKSTEPNKNRSKESSEYGSSARSESRAETNAGSHSKSSQASQSDNYQDKKADRSEERSVAGAMHSGSESDRPVAHSSTNKGESFTSDGESRADSLNRRGALQSFMRRMNQDLGVGSDELIDSFKSLNKEQLQLPPHMTADQVISGLNLNAEQQPVAKDIFNDLIARTNSQTTMDYLTAPGGQSSLETLGRPELQKQELQKSIDNLNRSFFIDQNNIKEQVQSRMANAQPAVVNPYMGATNNATAYDLSAMEMMGQNELTIPSEELPGRFASMQTDPARAQAAQAGMQGHSLNEVAEGSDDAGYDDLWLKSQSEQANSSNAGEAGQRAQQNLQQAKATLAALAAYRANQNAGQPSATYETAGQATTGEHAVTTSGGAQANSSEYSEGEPSFSQESFDSNLEAPVQASRAQKIEALVKPTGFAAELSDANAEEMNAKEVMSQAQYLIKKGGGEMKVMLTPEGLGDVNLKVAVENGRVNVEMLTESQEAKKLLEKGLHDLKASLADMKLNVETVRVDAASELSKHMERQEQEQQRHFAQQFLQDFRQQNQSFRQNLTDMPGVNMKGSGRDELEMPPMEPAKPRKSDTQRRLNLVA